MIRIHKERTISQAEGDRGEEENFGDILVGVEKTIPED